MKHVQMLFRNGSCATKEERDFATKTMRKRTITSLAGMLNSEAKKNSEELDHKDMFEPQDDAPQQLPVPERHEDVERTPTFDKAPPIGTQNGFAAEKENEYEEDGDKLPDLFLESVKDFGEE